MSDHQAPGAPNTSGAGSTPPPPPPPGPGWGGPPPPPTSTPGGPSPYGAPAPGYGGQPGYGQPGYGGQTGYGGQPPGGRRPGELLDRFLARLLDHLLLGVLNGVLISAVILGAVLNSDGSSYLGYGGGFLAGAISAILGVAISLGYFVFMETQHGRTLGKMVTKLHVEGASGGKPTVQESVKRNIWMALPLLGVVPILGGLIAAVGQLIAVILIAVGIHSDTARRQPWTDKLAGTQVIKEG